MRPGKTLRLAIPVLLVLALLVLWRWPRRGDSSPARSGGPSGLNLGGRGIRFELFDPEEGARLWRLDLGEVILTAAGIVEGRAVRAEFFGSVRPGRLTAAGVRYAPDRSRLVFLDGVRLESGGFTLSCRELAWDRKMRTFTAAGGYRLTKAASSAEGRELIVGEDWRTIRSEGSSSLTVSVEGGSP